MFAQLGGPAYWSVDLGGPHVVHNVTLFNRESELYYGRMSDMWIYLSNYSNPEEDKRICGRYLGTVPRAGRITVPSLSDKQGWYIHIESGANVFGREYLAICEVVVMGYKAIDCSSCPVTSACDALNGCQECPEGKRKPDCTQDLLPDNELEVESPCHCLNDTCESGTCSTGCQKWWTGPDCTKFLPEPSLAHVMPTVSSVGQSSILLKFRPLDIPSDISQHYHYEPQYATKDMEYLGGENTKVKHENGINFMSITLKDLPDDSLYSIWIMPYREVNDSSGTTVTIRDNGKATQQVSVYIPKSDPAKCEKSNEENNDDEQLLEGNCCDIPLASGITAAVAVVMGSIASVTTVCCCKKRKPKPSSSNGAPAIQNPVYNETPPALPQR